MFFIVSISLGLHGFVAQTQDAIRTRGKFSVALAGGNTLRRLCALLAADPFYHQIDWRAVHFFLGDERYVPANDPRSNFRTAPFINQSRQVIFLVSGKEKADALHIH